MICSNCGTENPPGRKFCGACGQQLALICEVCGAANEPRFAFCGECGSPLAGSEAAPARPVPTPAGRTAPVSERRLVSVLFTDLVGFTPLSESRDPDEVRDLLSGYFDTARQIVLRYGGTVEKFIGDAVMAVWGTPTAQEDDAERALRAALELVKAVEQLGAQAGAPELKARAGVLTGEAAVTIGAEAEGMVAGDLVNTAARIQAVAEPGTVLTGEATRRATEAAVAFEPAGTHELKGKAEPVALYRAVRVIGGLGGAMKSSGLEAPFVGRDRELRLAKDLLHSSIEERKAQLLQVIGIGGIGKSRLGWEMYKYIDGLADLFLWHRGRCLAYGDGVTYWALAEMVRGRCGILEGEDPESALAKLRSTVEDYLPDPEERTWVEPRLAHLLGLEDRTAREAEDLFSAWRLFFERLAARAPVLMTFEDMQWADRSLLEFVDYLLNWSRSHPIFVMALARPEVSERHPDWAVARRGSTTLHLEPLAEEDMHRLLTGLVPGLPEQLERQILDRAEGVPLYAVETVRMLLDRGLLAQEGAAYRLTGPVETLAVPETLHALIAARLDGLDPKERRVLQDAAVLGKAFTKGALAALTSLPDADLVPILSALVRKEVLFVQADPRSPERGQYGFLQDLVRRVAYETLSKKERKARHLSAAANLEAAWSGEEVEIVEILASHYVDAYRAVPDAADAAAIKARAAQALTRAGDRSGSLAAPDQAYRYFVQALELTDDPAERAALDERAGLQALASGRIQQAKAHLDEAIAGFEREGDKRTAALVSARLADVAFGDGRLEEALSRIQQSFDVLAKDEPDEGFAAVAGQMARLLMFTGRTDQAMEPLELALTLAEGFQLPEVFAHALVTKGTLLATLGRPDEGLVLLERGRQVAVEHDLHWAAFRAYNNLSSDAAAIERLAEADRYTAEGLALARKLGYRTWELKFWAGEISGLVFSGRWDEALARANELLESEVSFQGVFVEAVPAIQVLVNRGETAEAAAFLGRFAEMEASDEIQTQSWLSFARALADQATSAPAEAVAAFDRIIASREILNAWWDPVKLSMAVAADLSLSSGDPSKAEEILAVIEELRPGTRTPFLRATAARIRARLLGASGRDEGVEGSFRAAAAELRTAGMPFWLAVTLLDHAEWLAGQGRTADAEPLLAEATEIFERLRATPWIQRATRLDAPVAEPARAPRSG
jgi:class 3 adenylate cyclase/tetratricopeptide (TPR) repeat protein